MDPKFELDPKALDKKVLPTASPAPAVRPSEKPRHASVQGTTYTIKPGDNLFKILIREYGLNNDEAEKLVPRFRDINRLGSSKSLQVGKTIQLPSLNKLRGGAEVTARRGGKGKLLVRKDQPAASFHLDNDAREGGGGRMETVRQVWDSLLPASSSASAPVDIRSDSYSLSLDPGRYPVFPAADGGRIIVDREGTIPPLVKSLIMSQDPKTRVVAENPANRRRFFSSLLAAAKFYSVEEDFRMDFGIDPKLTVLADYKIEKNADSLMRNDIVLLNVNDTRRGIPPVLAGFLQSKGFHAVDSYPVYREGRHGEQHRVFQVTARDPQTMADSLMKSLAVPYEVDHGINLLGDNAGGVRLMVRADRYFEKEGSRYVVSFFDGDPVQYTLMRLLEGGGYRVILLEAQDDFRKVAEKFLARLRLPGNFAMHNLWSQTDSSYGIQMSGVILRDGKSEGRIFLTDREIDPLVKDLLEYNDFKVVRE
ncbi:LysM peptidoglycan-binding domain-containing protein [Geobacter sp. AOG1]|uniref:LysM peptidoglycan-binding domain-containing protein n=1 Tax=Geobacter sp. AOG1 TaxID=1566346 RepID=UPI001CC46988|nr:LysM peptidoglycan-binding domain-containing protein [Geobacter sp. AOG1]